MLVLCGWTVLLEAKKSIAESKAEYNDESASKCRIRFTPVLCKWYSWSSSKASKSWTSPTVLARCLQAPRLSVQWHRHTWKLAERKSPPDDHVVFRRCRQRTGKLVKFPVGVNYASSLRGRRKIPLPFFPSSLSPTPYPFRRLLRRLLRKVHTRHWLLRFYPWQICQSLLSCRLSNSAEGKKKWRKKTFPCG